jgi:membrane-bound lytic murein transglycosylase A
MYRQATQIGKLLQSIFKLVTCVVLIVSCAPSQKAKDIRLTKARYSDLKGWEHDKHLHGFNTFKKSCKIILANKKSKFLGNNPHLGAMSKWQLVCKNLSSQNIGSHEQARIFIEKNFTPYRVQTSTKNSGLFTGYYESSMRGSYKKTAQYKYPIYRSPKNLANIKNKLSRENINKDILAGKGLELAYVDDEVELFFMQIQGSGRIHMTDGSELRLGFADQNGFPYTSIGGYITKKYNINPSHISADFIKAWLRANPDKAREVMEQNQSYVFFRPVNLTRHEGPIGAQGIPLTTGRSIAVDRQYISYGTPLWLETTTSGRHCIDKATTPHHPFNRLMVAQDTGGAIKGAIRGDVFFGYGKVASEFASCMKNKGKYYLLLPK